MSVLDPTVSVVIPCFNEQGTLRELHQRIREQFTRLELTAEIIFIDDGSNDGSREIERQLAAEDPLCRIIAFRRNCGKAAGLDVGFRAARGEYIITMDADLQDDPAVIPRFLEALQHTDVVSGWKVKRLDPLGKTLPSKLFNATVRHFTGVKLNDMNCGFKGYRRQVVRELTLYGELHRFVPALAAARGFRIEELGVQHHPRKSGVSKYGWERLLRGFYDLITVVYHMKYRTRPLHFFGNFGISFSACGIALMAVLSPYMTNWYLARHNGDAPAWTYGFWFIATALLVLGPIFFGLGVLAESQLNATFRQQPEPPVVERINFSETTEVTAGEERHAG